MNGNIVNDKFEFKKRIGKGNFGEVYLATDYNKREVAVKVEKKGHNNLEFEYNILKDLKDIDSVPQIYDLIKTEKYNLMSMELLDKDVSKLVENKKISSRTIKRIGKNMINLIKDVHDLGYIHRDIKPSNFMIGKGVNKNKLYLVDFGLSKKYFNNNKHINFKIGRSLIGTARFSSINVHLGMEPSRRDDLESIGYLLVFLYLGKLPWQGLAQDKNSDYENIKNIGKVKMSVDYSSLCENIEFMKDYLLYCNSLKFKDNPNYDYLLSLFN